MDSVDVVGSASHPMVIDSWGSVFEHAVGGVTRVTVQDSQGRSFVVLSEEHFRTLDALARSNELRVPGAGVHLTDREREVLRCSHLGLPAAVVAQRLGIAQNTVAQHLVSVRRKFGVRSTVAAAALARQHDLI